MPVFVHAQGMKTVDAGREEDQKSAKFCPRSCCMPPKVNLDSGKTKITPF